MSVYIRNVKIKHFLYILLQYLEIESLQCYFSFLEIQKQNNIGNANFFENKKLKLYSENLTTKVNKYHAALSVMKKADTTYIYMYMHASA